MKLHLVTVPAEANTNTPRVFCGTGAEATATRMTIYEEIRDQGFRKADILIEPVDVPTDKSGLIDYLNTLLGS